MQRKFFKFIANEHQLFPLVAALGPLNQKPFEKACKEKGIYHYAITEEQAYKYLFNTIGVGCGCYVPVLPDYNEEEYIKAAAKANAVVAGIMGFYVVEPAIKLEPMVDIILAA